MELRPEEISRIIRSQIKHYEAKINQSETGTVILIGDGIAKAAGLTGCMVNELLEFPGGVYGMAQNLEENSVSIVMLGNEEGIREGDTVRRTGRVVSVPSATSSSDASSTRWVSRSTARVPSRRRNSPPSSLLRPAS